MFSHLIRAKYPDSVDLFKIPDVNEPFWKGHIEAGLQNNFLLSLWPGQKCSINFALAE